MAIIIGLWIITLLIRCKVFMRLSLSPYMSLIPFYGTYLVYKKVWNVSWFILFIISLFGTIYCMIFGILDVTACFVFIACVLLLCITWTGEKFYLAKSLNAGFLVGYGLAVFYPLFLIGLGFEKTEK